MSTRANIMIMTTTTFGDEKFIEKQLLYRHSDGYPEGTLPTLKVFMKWIISGKIRGNVSQSCGWLVLIGAVEYHTIAAKLFEGTKYNIDTLAKWTPGDWKCGAYEPAMELTGDHEFLYELDLTKKEIRITDVRAATTLVITAKEIMAEFKDNGI